MLGNGDATFQNHVDLATGFFREGVEAVVSGDFNGDGALDLAAADELSNSVFVFLESPVIALFPTNLSFGNQPVGTTSATETVTLSNPGAMPLGITGVTITGANSGNFAQSSACPATLGVGANCTLSVTFS